MVVGLLCAILLPVQLRAQFHASEEWIPKKDILHDIQAIHTIRLIQLIHWPVIKHRFLKKYPMIKSVRLGWRNYPALHVNIIEKSPWVMVMNNNEAHLFSHDGTWLNQGLSDVELPNQALVMVMSDSPISSMGKLMPRYLKAIQSIIKHVTTTPLLVLHHIVLSDGTIQLRTTNGMMIIIGDEQRMNEKFKMLKYFMGQYRHQLGPTTILDLQYSNRVIVR